MLKEVNNYLLKDDTTDDYDWSKRTICFYDKNKKEYAQMDIHIEYTPKYGGIWSKEGIFEYLVEEFKKGKIKTNLKLSVKEVKNMLTKVKEFHSL